MLKDFLDLENSQVVTLHIQSIDQNAAIKNIKAEAHRPGPHED